MEIDKSGVLFRNVERFVAFLDDVLVCPYGSYDLDACLDELDRDFCESGSPHYEIRGWETKSGNPEIIDFEVEFQYDSDECIQTVITF